MGFHLVPKSVTLTDLERHNGCYVASFYRAALNAEHSSQEKAVRPSVHLSNACIVTKRKKDLSRFL